MSIALLLDLPSREYIAQHSIIRNDPEIIFEKNSKKEQARRRRKRFVERGLTTTGKVRVNKQRPELAGIKDRKEYMRAYLKLNPKKR